MNYNCTHCGKSLTVTEIYAEVCQCEKSIQSETEYKERAKQLARQNKQTIEEARKNNKRPIRGK